ncbi:Matrix metalloproteinase-15 [Schistosoma japonicum]|nr:Matrix metalloproteinase-15 [Schistosoma japonicum]
MLCYICINHFETSFIQCFEENNQNLLYRYGYMDDHNNVNNGNPIAMNQNLYESKFPYPDKASLTNPPKEFKTALKKFQIQYNLPVTGELDETTKNLLISPRCGNPDNQANLQQNNFRQSSSASLLSRLQLGNTFHFTHNNHSLTVQYNNYYNNKRRRQKRYLIGDEKMKWTKKQLTWQIQSYPSHSLSRVRAHAVFQHTFNLWSRVVNLDFIEEKDYYKPADIVIRFGAGKHGDSIPFDGAGGVLAHAYYPTPDNVYSFSGDAHFDDDEIWNDGPHKTHRNLISVAAHELGHSLGLGHSSVPTAIMYPYYTRSWEKVKLDPDDIAGIQQIYGAAKPGKFIPPEPSLPDIPPPPPVTTEAPKRENVFDFCNISVDAIIKIRNLELYVFKGEWQWRVTWSKTVTTWITYQFRDGPAKITYYWPALPKYVDYINAGIERHDAAIYIFRDRKFWLLLDNMRMKPGFPSDGLPLTDLGLPSYLKRVDSVFLWGENQAIYIFAGEYYWRLNENSGPFGRVISGPDYPRLIADTWQGVPIPTQAAFTALNDETLFFEGTNYYVFDNIAMRTRPGYPKQASLGILGCMK